MTSLENSSSSDDNIEPVVETIADKSKLTYKQCVSQIKEVYLVPLEENNHVSYKHNIISDLLRRYYRSEESDDLFEGFFHLMVSLHNFTKNTDGYFADFNLPLQVLKMFYEHLDKLELQLQEEILNVVPEDKEKYNEAMKIISLFSPQKHLFMISRVFRFQDDNREQLLRIIKHLLKNNEVVKAVNWIVFFDLRDHFPFEEVVCHLFLNNELHLLEAFIGTDTYRQKSLITFFDQLVCCELRKLKPETELGNLILQDTKKLEKAMSRYVKLYNLPDPPNFLDLRYRSAILYHHYRWVQRKITLANYEEMILEAMGNSNFIKIFYLHFLCKHDMQRNALYFAYMLKVSKKDYPKKLITFEEEFPDEAQTIKKEAEM